MKLNNIIYILSVGALTFSACKKDALDQKTDIHLTVPSTVDDYQQLLDGLSSGTTNNTAGLFSYRSLGDYMSDDIYLTDNSYNNFFSSVPFIAKLYAWDKNLFSPLSKLNEWEVQYKTVLTANVALEGIGVITPDNNNQAAWNNVKGSALFLRGQMFYNLAQFWAQPYNSASATKDQGIVLRLSSDADVASVRSTVDQTYKQIISDLTAAAELLPNTSSQNTQVSKVRPSKAAAFALLARTYLTMGDYTNVIRYTDSTLNLYSSLLDYSTLGVTKFYEVPNFHSEILYYCMDQSGEVGGTFGFWNASQDLYDSYADNDLRKSMFYNNSFFYGLLFVGDYSGDAGRRFMGVAVDELYLMRAEAYARTDDPASAMADLNTLLVKRWKEGTFIPYTASSADDALVKIIAERRKELPGRGLRWTDLRRLNTDARFAVTITHTLLGQTYTLPANDSRYTLQVPAYIIAASNGSIIQTP
ncbi:SusD family protein [Chitinophaga sp. YR573]|uniref:RagB/SusD family nutrient uptake outer membrane protein n=1 Tax=Chitinophaga sp. YR573 TaxID=1881040 RepID=UPI0008D5743A|nr:RagB/SusD family nutrient uptake outer membrane protein [Chitinophaga sp. YR573]SEW43339.1 SusD family protein [Chitinophaga sp. YR573]